MGQLPRSPLVTRYCWRRRRANQCGYGTRGLVGHTAYRPGPSKRKGAGWAGRVRRRLCRATAKPRVASLVLQSKARSQQTHLPPSAKLSLSRTQHAHTLSPCSGLRHSHTSLSLPSFNLAPVRRRGPGELCRPCTRSVTSLVRPAMAGRE